MNQIENQTKYLKVINSCYCGSEYKFQFIEVWKNNFLQLMLKDNYESRYLRYNLM